MSGFREQELRGLSADELDVRQLIFLGGGGGSLGGGGGSLGLGDDGSDVYMDDGLSATYQDDVPQRERSAGSADSLCTAVAAATAAATTGSQLLGELTGREDTADENVCRQRSAFMQDLLLAMLIDPLAEGRAERCGVGSA
jgi:hypothetical protein